MRCSPGSGDRGLADVQRHAVLSSEPWRPDRHYLEFQRWLVAGARHAEDVPTTDGGVFSGPRPIDHVTYSQAPRDVAHGG